MNVQAPWIGNPPEDRDGPTECPCGTMTKRQCDKCDGPRCSQCSVGIGDQMLCSECYDAWLTNQPCDEDEVAA